MKWQDLKCFFGRHDIVRPVSPPGIMEGLFGPVTCRNCSYFRDGHPYPDWPMPPVKEPKPEYHVTWHPPQPDTDRVALLENHVASILSDMIALNKRMTDLEVVEVDGKLDTGNQE